MAPTGQGWDNMNIKKKNDSDRVIKIHLNSYVYNKYKLKPVIQIKTLLVIFKGYKAIDSF